MNLDRAMLALLGQIQSADPSLKLAHLKVAAEETGYQLIDHYYRTPSFNTRALILEFMQCAGSAWVKKLITRDTDCAEEIACQATLAEYVALAASNDPRRQWFKTA